MHQQGGWIYMLASGREGRLYTGTTTDLVRRVFMHKQGIASHFTRRHGVTALVWYEHHPRIESAARHSELLRHRRREWKLEMVGRANPEWIDLYYIITALPQFPQMLLSHNTFSGTAR